MKSLLALLSALALTLASTAAKTLHFPSRGACMFTITIPDNWEPEKDDDEVLEALSPNEHVYLCVWELESKEDLSNLKKDIKDLLKDHAKNIKIDGEGVEARPGGLEGTLFKGTAKDKEDGHAIDFFTLIVSDKKKVAAVFIEADADTPKNEAAKLQKILESITPPGAKKLLHATLALDEHTKPSTTFTPDAPKIWAFYIGDALKPGDKVRGVWIAEDVGDAAPRNTKIDEATLTAQTPTDQSGFSLSRPEKGWPTGSYRVEIYVGDTLSETLKFTVKKS